MAFDIQSRKQCCSAKHDWMNFNHVSLESILIILHEINDNSNTSHNFCPLFQGSAFFLGHIVKAFQNNFAFIISTETCFWLKRVSDRTLAVFSSFNRNSFQYPQSYRDSKRVSKRLSRVVAFIIDFSVSRVRVTRKALSLRSCIAQFHPKHNAFKGVSKQLCVYHLYRSVFLAQTRIRSPFFPRFRKAFLTP